MGFVRTFGSTITHFLWYLIDYIILFSVKVVLGLATKILLPVEVVLCSQSEVDRVPLSDEPAFKELELPHTNKKKYYSPKHFVSY